MEQASDRSFILPKVVILASHKMNNVLVYYKALAFILLLYYN